MKIAHGTLVMAADGKKALLLRNEGDAKFTVLQTLVHEEIANPQTHELGTDRPGRSFASAGTRRSGYGETDRHQQAEDRFARHVAEMLAHASQEDEVGLVIVAPPHFLGALRAELSDSVRRRVRAEIAKDLVHHETDDIARAISRHLEGRPAPWA